MADIKKILDAIGALVEAIPGASRNVNVNMHACSDAAVYALVEHGATLEHYTNESGTERWDAASIKINGVTLCAFGQHHPRKGVAEADVAKIDAALAQAQEVLS